MVGGGDNTHARFVFLYMLYKPASDIPELESRLSQVDQTASVQQNTLCRICNRLAHSPKH